MFTRILTRVFGSRNDRLIKGYNKSVQRINALEPAISALSDEALRAKTAEFKERLAQGETLDDLLPEAFAVVREAGKRVLNMRHFDVQLIGGMILHAGKICGDAHRRGQDPGRDAGRLSECAVGPGRAHRHRERLPRQPRCRLDGPRLSLPRTLGRSESVAERRRREAAGLRGRHHLRHQQRVRFRLPARQHGDAGGGPLPAPPQFRHRRRGRLDPDRRGAHAADHLRPGRRSHRSVLPHERGGAAARAPDGGGRSRATSPWTKKRARCC